LGQLIIQSFQEDLFSWIRNISHHCFGERTTPRGLDWPNRGEERRSIEM